MFIFAYYFTHFSEDSGVGAFAPKEV